MIPAREFDFEVDGCCTKVSKCWKKGEVEFISMIP